MKKIMAQPCDMNASWMNILATIVPCMETSELMDPRLSPFDNPSRDAQSAPVVGLAQGQDRSDPALSQLLAMALGIVSSITLDSLGT